MTSSLPTTEMITSIVVMVQTLLMGVKVVIPSLSKAMVSVTRE